MKSSKLAMVFSILMILIISAFSSASGQGNHECHYAVELYSVNLLQGDSLPPVYPEMWMINYPQNVYFAPDADKLLKRDFGIASLTHVGSYRIIKNATDSIIFLNSNVELLKESGWNYKVRSSFRLGRQIERADHFIYNDDGRKYPFSVNMIVNPTVIYCFRPEQNSKEVLFMFFSYTMFKNFPKSLLNEFDPDQGFTRLGYDPLKMQFPEAVVKPKLVYKAEAEYPAHLQRMKRTGEVKLVVLVDRDGTVSRADIITKALYTPFDVSAVDAAYKSLYIPGQDADGNAVPTWIDFEVQFKLK